MSKDAQVTGKTVFLCLAVLSITCVKNYVMCVKNPQNNPNRQKFMKNVSFVILQLPMTLKNCMPRPLPDSAEVIPSTNVQFYQTKVKDMCCVPGQRTENRK